MLTVDVANTHTPGSNCGTNASKVLIQAQGYPFSEAMTFGCGSGLGFIYQYYKKSDECFLSGKNESLELNLATLLGGEYVSGNFDDPDKAFNTIIAMVDEGIPVILDLSIKHLPYFKPYLASLNNIGFGLHNAIMTNYDRKNQTVTLLDHRWAEPKVIAIEELKLAMGATESGVNPRSNYRSIILPYYSGSHHQEIIQAVELNIHRMKYPFAFKMGLKGLSTFRKELLTIVSNDELYEKKQETIATFGILMEKLGTGGGNFRRIYGRFLQEAAEITGNRRFLDSAVHYKEAAKEWKLLSKLLTRPMLNQKEQQLLDSCLTKIIETENQGIQLLERIIKE